MIMTLDEGCEKLRVERGANDALIESLIESIPAYIEVQTGMSEAEQEQQPLAKTAAGLILTLWYFSEHAEDEKLKRAIDSILKALSLMVKS